MSATDELRKLLDERGVEHEDSHEVTVTGLIEWEATIWLGVAGVRYIAVSCDDCDGKEGCVFLYGVYLTPEQAIAATLGRPKVKKVRGLTYDHHGGEVEFLACSGCGEWIDGDLDCIGEADGPNYCHNCGGEFDGPLLCRVCGKLADMDCGDLCFSCDGEGGA